jgi:hypothetical protein
MHHQRRVYIVLLFTPNNHDSCVAVGAFEEIASSVLLLVSYHLKIEPNLRSLEEQSTKLGVIPSTAKNEIACGTEQIGLWSKRGIIWVLLCWLFLVV